MTNTPTTTREYTADELAAMTDGERLLATAATRRYRIVENAKTGRRTLRRQNRLTGAWKFNAREGSTAWRVGLDMVERGWAVLVDDDATPANVDADEVVCEGSRRAGRDLRSNSWD